VARLTVLCEGALGPPHPDRSADGVFTWVQDDGTLWGHGFRVGDERWLSLPNVGRFRFGASGGEAAAIPDPGVDREMVVDAYRRCVLPMALHAHGSEVLHASAIVIRRRVVALCAHARTGKSTLAFALGLRGHRTWADDAVAFEFDGSRLLASAQPFHLRLRSSAEAFFETEDLPSDPDERAHEPAERVLLGAVVLLERADDVDDVEMMQLKPADALTGALEHAYSYDLTDPERKRRMIETYTELAAATPTWRLRFRPGFERIGRVVDAVEAAAADGDP
jgi:hypothetical protein